MDDTLFRLHKADGREDKDMNEKNIDLKMLSVSDLAFKALDKITADEDELWVAHAIFNNEASRTGEIQKIMKEDCSVAYSAVQGVLKTLVEKGTVIRVHRGKYAPNLKMLLPKMIEILEAKDVEK